jgi:small subunit ribosomal protein S4
VLGSARPSATTRAQARQFIAHGHIRVNGRRIDRPSYEVSPGDMVTLRPSAAIEPTVREAAESTATVPAWLLADHDNLTGRVERLPHGHESDAPVNPQLDRRALFEVAAT